MQRQGSLNLTVIFSFFFFFSLRLLVGFCLDRLDRLDAICILLSCPYVGRWPSCLPASAIMDFCNIRFSLRTASRADLVTLFFSIFYFLFSRSNFSSIVLLHVSFSPSFLPPTVQFSVSPMACAHRSRHCASSLKSHRWPFCLFLALFAPA